MGQSLKIKHFTAKTFTCKYDPKEDRLLLTLNYQSPEERIDFWVTRSFLLKLLPIFFDISTLSPATSQQDRLPKTSLMSTLESPTDTSTYLLTYKKPLLLESVDFSRENTNTKILFKNLEQGIHYEALLDSSSLDSVVKLVLNNVPKYEWGIYSI